MARALLSIVRSFRVEPKKNNMAKIKTILYCEDDVLVLTLYRRQLQQAGYHVIPAMDGLEAMKHLSMFVPDLLVLDLMMPKFNGEEVLKFVCSNPRLVKVPLVILSSNSIVDVQHEHLLERADRRLLKHKCTPALLLEAIRELFSGQLEETPAPARPLNVFEDPFASAVRSAA